jgi:hypothetical protein
MSGRVKQMRRLERRWAGNGLRPNIGTLRTIIQGALKERAAITGISEYQLSKNQFSHSRQLLEQGGHVPSVMADRNLDSIFAWGREMFRRFGLDEREIDYELGVATDMLDM